MATLVATLAGIIITSLWQRIGDLILTPFAGAGSECVAAKECQRHYIGFEIDEQYIAVAKERLKNACIESDEEKIDNPDEIVGNGPFKEEKKKKYNQPSIFDMEINPTKGDKIYDKTRH